MKNEELYHKTVKVLKEAFNNGNLVHGNMCSCAIGTMVKNSCPDLPKVGHNIFGATYMPSWYINLLQRRKDNDTLRNKSKDSKQLHSLVKKFGEKVRNESERQLTATGYTIEELDMIENAFETTRDPDNEENSYNGAMAVLDTLEKIHETNIMITDCSKVQFKKP